ncbi:cell division protein FtsQ [Hoeflea marina]|uniref:Cell division protein FtsQ n=1 Tax=Hoeflea marina TaxID=274592 RepID=A0A317PI25_9HYPH|nr:cell division protein FtsQ/DivIB [Hoeflea marina]PWV99242.1 cell division protein FtsQ [Hoeflea marina]
MSPLTGTRATAGLTGEIAGRHALRDALVLPRVMRRPVRFLAALAGGRVAIPAHVGSVGVAALFVATGLYGMSLGGHTESVSQALTTGAGFALEDITIAGNTETSDIDILQQLGLDGTTSVIALSADAARQSLIGLPWIADAKVSKVYPRALSIQVTERQAAGIWQHGTDLSLIDARGDIIAPLTGARHAELPLYVGLGADRHADELEARLLFHPDIRARVKAAIRVADRRWDLRLDNGVTISLPEHDVEAAFDRFYAFDGGRGVLDRDITLVDLRLEDRITLRLSPASLERREKALTLRDKAIKASKRT